MNHHANPPRPLDWARPALMRERVPQPTANVPPNSASMCHRFHKYPGIVFGEPRKAFAYGGEKQREYPDTFIHWALASETSQELRVPSAPTYLFPGQLPIV